MNTTAMVRPDNDRLGNPASGPWIGDGKKPTVSRLRARTRSRGVPYLVLGLLLVLACVSAFVLVSLNTGNRRPVLALARGVSVGQVLTEQDVRQVNVAVDSGVAVVGVDQATTVLGRALATNLSAGALLTPDSVGGSTVPPAGQAVAALALKPGQVPAEVTAGARVSVVFMPHQVGATSSPLFDTGMAWPAVVTSVATAANEQSTVVSVQLGEAAARQVAAIPAGQLSLVLLSTGGR